jgi:hypothetical protein
MWLEEYAEKLAHFFEFLLPQAKLRRGITRDLVGESDPSSISFWLSVVPCVSFRIKMRHILYYVPEHSLMYVTVSC